jgi:competence protein ComEA
LDAWLATHRASLSLALVVVALLGAAVYLGGRGDDRPLVIANPSPSTSSGGPKAYITGEVARPGVYPFEPGDRVEQLVALAGGFTPEADHDAVNLALRLKDEQQVHVPRLSLDPAPATTPGAKLIDLNSASSAELESLPGIGPALAQRIVEHRDKVGPFERVEDLQTLKIITGSTYEKVRPLVTVR